MNNASELPCARIVCALETRARARQEFSLEWRLGQECSRSVHYLLLAVEVVPQPGA
jgi:hypothetical protein